MENYKAKPNSITALIPWLCSSGLGLLIENCANYIISISNSVAELASYRVCQLSLCSSKEISQCDISNKWAKGMLVVFTCSSALYRMNFDTTHFPKERTLLLVPLLRYIKIWVTFLISCSEANIFQFSDIFKAVLGFLTGIKVKQSMKASFALYPIKLTQAMLPSLWGTLEVWESGSRGALINAAAVILYQISGSVGRPAGQMMWFHWPHVAPWTRGWTPLAYTENVPQWELCNGWWECKQCTSNFFG